MTNLYEFKTLAKSNNSSVYMPEALTFGGVNIDGTLSGFRTLNVNGRENFSRTITTAKSSGDGELFISSKIDTNEITINYDLNAATIPEFNEKYTALKRLLQGDEVPFSFADESEYTRYGTVKSLTVDDPTNIIDSTGKIIISMSDPFRYSGVTVLNGTSSVKINDSGLFYGQQLDSIAITVGSTTDKLILYIDNYKMTLNRAFDVGTVITINFVDKTVKYGLVSLLNTIDINNTDIFEATVKNGSNVSCSIVNNMVVNYRKKIL